MHTQPRVDLHTHSLLSDGALLASEMLRRAEVLGYGALAITDHVDATNVQEVVAALQRLADERSAGQGTLLIPGVEITHVPPQHIAPLALRARKLGARLVVVHGETPVEPVASNTNRAAVECPNVDILAHPGFLTQEEADLAAANGVALELSSRGGHNITNGHVARIARLAGAQLVVNTDTHAPADMMDQSRARLVALGAGLTEAEAHSALVSTAWALVAKATGSQVVRV